MINMCKVKHLKQKLMPATSDTSNSHSLCLSAPYAPELAATEVYHSRLQNLVQETYQPGYSMHSSAFGQNQYFVHAPERMHIKDMH